MSSTYNTRPYKTTAEGLEITVWLENQNKTDTEGISLYSRLDLPFDEDDLSIALGEIDFEDGDTYIISEYECNLGFIWIKEDMDLWELNTKFDEIRGLSNDRLDIFEALVESEKPWETAIDYVDDNTLLYGINSDFDLGSYWIENFRYNDISSDLIQYLDFEQYGADVRSDHTGGDYTSLGYLYSNY